MLISTDVLSEGVNLQDGSLLVNYDLHWNPVRLMQRIGRIDRRMDAEVEQQLLHHNPKLKGSRGKILIRNFLPPDHLETLLHLYSRIQSKVLLISKTLGIPGGKLITAEDELDDVKVMQEFADERVGELSPIEELRLQYQALTTKDPALADRIRRLPDGISTAKRGEPAGVFVCRRLPVLERNEDGSPGTSWSSEPGRVDWALQNQDGSIQRSLTAIDAATSATPDIPAVARGERVVDWLRAFEREETQRYRKDVQLPLDAPTPKTLCWMEIR